jgi:uncharacterized protein RhaS with RHS repeats
MSESGVSNPIQYSYDPTNNLTQIVNQTLLYVTYAYDSLNRVSEAECSPIA